MSLIKIKLGSNTVSGAKNTADQRQDKKKNKQQDTKVSTTKSTGFLRRRGSARCPKCE
jgi:hypothetical protein